MNSFVAILAELVDMRHIIHGIFAPHSLRSRGVPAVVIACAALLIASPAHAGFKYLPTSTTQQPQLLSLPTGAPVASPPAMLPASAAAPATRAGTVEGFADKVPLTVALRQILPKGVMFSVADDVDVATQVSWRGGRAWQPVLDDMLAAAGLKAVYSPSMVLVEKGGAAAPFVAMNDAPITLREPAPRDIQPTIIDAPTPLVAPAAAPVPAPEPMTLTAPVAQNADLMPPATYNDAPAPVAMEMPTLTPPPVAAPSDEPAPVVVKQPKPKPAGKLTARQLTAMELERIDNTPNATSPAPAAPVSTDAMPTAGILVAPSGMLPDAAVADAPAPAAIAVPDMPMVDNTPVAAMAPAAPAAGVMSPAATMPSAWEAKAGQTLHEVLSDWAQRAGIELNWLSEYDYPIQASMTINGNFETAVRTLLTGFANASPQPVGRLHHNEQLGQLSLVIEMRGNLYND